MSTASINRPSLDGNPIEASRIIGCGSRHCGRASAIGRGQGAPGNVREIGFVLNSVGETGLGWERQFKRCAAQARSDGNCRRRADEWADLNITISCES